MSFSFVSFLVSSKARATVRTSRIFSLVFPIFLAFAHATMKYSSSLSGLLSYKDAPSGKVRQRTVQLLASQLARYTSAV